MFTKLMIFHRIDSSLCYIFYGIFDVLGCNGNTCILKCPVNQFLL